MKTIFETFKKSVYDPAFYRTVTEAPLQKAFKFYFKSILFLSLVLTIVLGIFFVPRGVSFVNNRAPELVKTYYSKDLTVDINKGIASANVSMPYFVSLNGFGPVATSSPVQNMLVIDTTKDFDKKTFEGYKTFALLTSTDIVTMNNTGQTTIQSLRGLDGVKVNQESLLALVEKIKFNVWMFVVAGLLITFVAVFLGYVVYLVPLLLFALVPKVIAYVKGEPLRYASAFKLSLYAIIPALALKTLFNISGIFFLPEYLTFLVFMLIVAVNMKDQKEPTLFEEND